MRYYYENHLHGVRNVSFVFLLVLPHSQLSARLREENRQRKRKSSVDAEVMQLQGDNTVPPRGETPLGSPASVFSQKMLTR